MENTNNLELLENAFERTSILKTLAAGAIDKLADLETVLPPADLDRVNETTDFITALQHEIEALKDDLSEAVRNRVPQKNKRRHRQQCGANNRRRIYSALCKAERKEQKSYRRAFRSV